MEQVDVAVIGGGIIGLATALAVVQARPRTDLVVLDKEDGPATHQSGRNSGVIHSGVYYRSGSLKAQTTAAGRKALLDFCQIHGIAHRILGKVIVAGDETERVGLLELERRARDSAVPAELIGPERLAELEPHAIGVAALHVPGAGVVNFADVCRTLVRLLEEAGGEFRPRSEVVDLSEQSSRVRVTMHHTELDARVVVNCGGLHSDQLAACQRGREGPLLRIIPFRGEYRLLVSQRAHLVRSMIYPVPDPRFPFLGVHLTRGVGGDVHAGPNAVLALAREGYTWGAMDLADLWDLLGYAGFRRMAARHWKTGLGEVRRSLSSRALVQALQRLVPDITAQDLVRGPAGVRAQAVDTTGALVEDFVVEASARLVHVLNAPSPAATASLEIGRMVATRVIERL